MNPDRDSSSKWGDGRLSEEGDVSENLRILGYSPSYRSRLVADQGPWGQGCERTTFRCSDSFVKPKSVRLPRAWNSRDVSLREVPMERPVSELLPSLAALPQNQTVTGSCGAREPGLDFHQRIGVLPSSPHHCMRCCDESAFCVQGDVGNASSPPQATSTLQLALAVTEDSALSLCSAGFVSACKGLYRHAFSCGCCGACSQSLW